MIAYLSPEWIEALAIAARHDDRVRDAASGRTVGITQVVTAAEGDVVYHVSVDDGTVDVGPGPAPSEDVRFTVPRPIAEAVALGRVNAQEAFIGGELELAGDLSALRRHGALLVALDQAWRPVRERTDHRE